MREANQVGAVDTLVGSAVEWMKHRGPQVCSISGSRQALACLSRQLWGVRCVRPSAGLRLTAVAE